MKKYIYVSLFLCGIIHSQAQVNEDFSDTNLLTNPMWHGQTDSFIVNNSFQLQLNTASAGTSYISTSSHTVKGKTEWSFWIKFGFSGSANNYTKFYIATNDNNLIDTSLQGYYFRFGENGNADAVRFYKQKGTQHQLLFSDKDSAIAGSFSMYIKIIYSDSGYWKYYSAYGEGKNYTLEKIYNDTIPFIMTHLGLVCTYTKSNSTKFYFDDIYCDEVYTDKKAPFIDSISFVDEKHTVFLRFNEAVDSISALTLANYTLSLGSIHPDTIIALQSNFSDLQLIFNQPFPPNISGSLQIENIADIAGNIMNDTLFHFLFYHASIFDVVINEIMAKPTPQQELPDVEYIELKNRTPFEINLKGWKLYFGKTIRTFENCHLPPYQYVIVSSKSDTSFLSSFGYTAGLSSMTVTDDGQLIQLIDNKGIYIHSVDFTPAWHLNNKSEGGWSLEMIDYDNPCTESDNWTSSINQKGGTPGQQNSVYTSNPDNKAPALLRICSQDSTHLTIFFSEKMRSETLQNSMAYQIDRNIGIDSVLGVSLDSKSVNLLLTKILKTGVSYNLSICDTISDCMGNVVPLKSSICFGYTQLPNSFDIIINEVLFNPKSEGVDFVEIYNRSGKIIDLKNVRLATLKNNKPDTGKCIYPEGFQLFPEEYALLSNHSEIIQTQYRYKNETNFITMTSFPTFANEDGVVILLSDTIIIDQFEYSEDMHYPLLKTLEGVSLERINPNRKTQDASNWHSAASTVGFATPCYLNSNYCDEKNTDARFEIYPDIFSPDQDGYNDILHIAYQMEEVGYRASITIYSSSGKKIKTLVNNILLDTHGDITWDGTSDENIKAATGVYIVIIDFFNLKGDVKRTKLSCTLAIKH